MPTTARLDERQPPVAKRSRESIETDQQSTTKTRLFKLTQTSPAIYLLPSFAIVSSVRRCFQILLGRCHSRCHSPRASSELSRRRVSKQTLLVNTTAFVITNAPILCSR